MSDNDLIARLRKADEYEPLGHDGWEAADRIEALVTDKERLEAALRVARVHVANNAEGWSVSRSSARDDLTVVDAALTQKEPTDGE